jgi:hypothetical protein
MNVSFLVNTNMHAVYTVTFIRVTVTCGDCSDWLRKNNKPLLKTIPIQNAHGGRWPIGGLVAGARSTPDRTIAAAIVDRQQPDHAFTACLEATAATPA